MRAAAGSRCAALRLPRVPQAQSSPPAFPQVALSRQLELTADAVLAVRQGRSLTDALARCPADLRAGVQALSFHVMRWQGGALEVRQALAPKTPPPNVDALLVTALALLWSA